MTQHQGILLGEVFGFSSHRGRQEEGREWHPIVSVILDTNSKRKNILFRVSGPTKSKRTFQKTTLL